MIKLSREDWQEISAAIATKIGNVAEGIYRMPCSSDKTPADFARTKRKEDKIQRNWLAHLRRIDRKLGPDGERAIERGVKAVQNA